jgi:hypothetical protein
MRVLSALICALATLALGGCIEGKPGSKGDPGPAGAAGPAGTPGPAGPGGTVVRFVDGECRTPCVVACEADERILSTYALNPGGTFTYEADNRATFRPQQPGVSAKVVLACVPR